MAKTWKTITQDIKRDEHAISAENSLLKKNNNSDDDLTMLINVNKAVVNKKKETRNSEVCSHVCVCVCVCVCFLIFTSLDSFLSTTELKFR